MRKIRFIGFAMLLISLFARESFGDVKAPSDPLQASAAAIIAPLSDDEQLESFEGAPITASSSSQPTTTQGPLDSWTTQQQ